MNENKFVEWAEFWEIDRPEHDWLIEPILARGRGHSIFASHKTGKSLVCQWIAAHLASTDPDVVIVYLDYEMGEDDLYERLVDMGYGPDVDLSRLRYSLLPTLPPLDTLAGSQALLHMLDGVQSEFPAHHLAVFIDTTSRAFSGPEDTSDTTRAFYRHTGIQLKRRGFTWTRLDHAGKDRTRGQRGSSAKGDDVDVVWELRTAPDGFTFQRDAARMAWIPEKVSLKRISEKGLEFAIARTYPNGMVELVGILMDMNLPVESSVRQARAALAEHGIKAAQVTLAAAVRFRKSVTDSDS